MVPFVAGSAVTGLVVKERKRVSFRHVNKLELIVVMEREYPQAVE